MYSLVLIAALAPSAGDLPGDAAVAPPGGGEVPAVASPAKNGGFFHRLFTGRTKEVAPASAPAPAIRAEPTSSTTPTSANQAKPTGGFFRNFFKRVNYEKVSPEQEKKWEKSCLGNPD